MRYRFLLYCLLMLLVSAYPIHAQKDSNATMNPTPSPTEALWATPKPTNAPSAKPFLLIRPLHEFQVSLLGPLDSQQQENLTVVLKSLLEESLYLAMVESFVPDVVDNVFTRPNMTKEEIANLSILSKVLLEWTVAKSTIVSMGSTNSSSTSSKNNSTNTTSAQQNLPNMHILQASGSLGFRQYDFALLHPHTILPLQERIFAASYDPTSPLSLSDLEVSLQLDGSFDSLKVLELRILEVEEGPTQSPSTWEWNHNGFDDDDTKNQNGNKPREPTTSTHHDDDDVGTEGLSNQSTSKKSIATAITVTVVLCAIASVIFVVFVRMKTRHIKKELYIKQQRFISKKNTDEESSSEDDNAQEDSTNNVSISTPSLFSSVTTSVQLTTKSTSSSSVEPKEFRASSTTASDPSSNSLVSPICAVNIATNEVGAIAKDVETGVELSSLDENMINTVVSGKVQVLHSA